MSHIPNAHQYPWIVAWGRYLGSFDYFITAELERARADSAPRTAISRKHIPPSNPAPSHEWTTADDLAPALRAKVAKLLPPGVQQ